SREASGSTFLGEGLALPHPRYPIVLPTDAPFITLCFLAQPIPYGANDREPVHTLFALVSPTVRLHLALLARLGPGRPAPGFREAVRRKAAAEEILEQARRVEDALAAGTGAAP